MEEIRVAKARVTTLVDQFMTDVEKELRFVPTEDGPTVQELRSTPSLAAAAPLHRKNKARVSAKAKAQFIKLAKKAGAHPYALGKKLGLNDSTVASWVRDIKAGKL